jgi:4-amino-4-deoxychorismate lyase
LVNGEIGAHVPVQDRGLAYGDGVFETIAMNGTVPRFWQGHMDRLARGCKRLGLRLPPQEVLLREVQTVAAGQSACVVKIILTRGSGGRGYQPMQGTPPLRVVTLHHYPDGIHEAMRQGVNARFCDLRLALQPALGGIKHLSRLEQVLAAQEMLDYPDMAGILLNTEGFVISGISANLMLVFGNQLMTPRMDRCGVHGVLRGRILRDHKPPCELRRVSQAMLLEADEVFFCSAIRGIVPVLSLGDSHWHPGPVTRQLQEWFLGLPNVS